MVLIFDFLQLNPFRVIFHEGFFVPFFALVILSLIIFQFFLNLVKFILKFFPFVFELLDLQLRLLEILSERLTYFF